jgi:hypothetical protein
VEETVAEMNAVSKYRTHPVCWIAQNDFGRKIKNLPNGVQKF